MSFNSTNNAAQNMGKASGKAFIDGLGVGLREESYRAIPDVENVYVKLESLTKNAAKNAEKLQKKQQERRLDNLKNSLKLGVICEQEYYEQLKVFRDENLSQGTDDWYKCPEEIAAYNRKLLEETQKQYEKIMALREELSEKLSKKLGESEPWLESSRVIFKGLGENGADLVYNDIELNNFRKEVEVLESYRDRLLELKALGNVPQGIFSDIAAMSVEEGLQAANNILLADESMRKKFFAGYTGHKAAAEGISQELLDLLYGDELGLTETSGAEKNSGSSGDFAQVLKMSFKDVPESYYTLGENAGDSFGEGFLARIPKVMDQVREYFVASIGELSGRLAAGLKQTAETVALGTSNTFNTSYTFNTSKDTTTQQLFAAQNAAALDRLRGGDVK